VSDARQFRLDIDRWLNQEVPAKAAETQRMMAAEALTQCVQATPVGNNTKWKANIARAAKGLPALPKGYVGGQARRNWQVGIGTSPRTVINGTDANGSQAMSDGYAKIASLTAPGRVFITNPLDYMDALENGWSKQAPQGMVAQAVANISAKYARVR
jgi:hypothetical protein